MNPKIKNLLVRTLSGLVYITLMIAGVFFFPLMALLLCVVACIGLFEFSKLTSGPTDKLSRYLMMFFTVCSFALVYYAGTQPSNILLTTGMTTTLVMYALIPVFLMLYVLIISAVELFRHRPCPIEQMGKYVFGMAWIVIPLLIITAFTRLCPVLVLAFLLMIWLYDTFAYLGGSLFGRTKMCEKISPKKTWEGTFTGFVLTIIVAALLPSIPFFGNLLVPVWAWVAYAVVVIVFGTIGDLLESLFKRNAGVKDSGNIMPGHGGILDRFDSILFAAFPAMLFAFLVMLK